MKTVNNAKIIQISKVVSYDENGKKLVKKLQIWNTGLSKYDDI